MSYLGKEYLYEKDHKFPFALGGESSPENLQLLIPSVNRSKKHYPMEWQEKCAKTFDKEKELEFAKGLLMKTNLYETFFNLKNKERSEFFWFFIEIIHNMSKVKRKQKE